MDRPYRRTPEWFPRILLVHQSAPEWLCLYTVGGGPTPEPRLEGCYLPTAQGQRMAFKREIR